MFCADKGVEMLPSVICALNVGRESVLSSEIQEVCAVVLVVTELCHSPTLLCLRKKDPSLL